MPGHSSNSKSIYKDTVVIGNGPSAISLSYMLSGNVPYYTGRSNDDLLHARLSQEKESPLVLQDLKELSEGLEGRSSNTVSLLFDALAHPDADLGIESPSLLSWKNRPDLTSTHVVLGPDMPGGAWRMMDNDVLTVSLGTWMELPNLKMSEWAGRECEQVGKRVNVSLVAEYYKQYVKIMGLDKNFVNQAHVTRVRKIPRWQSDCNMIQSPTKKLVPSASTMPDLGRYGRIDEEDEVFQFSEEFSDESSASSRSPKSASIPSTNGFETSMSSSSVVSNMSMARASSRSSSNSSLFYEEDYCNNGVEQTYSERYALSATPMGRYMREQAILNAKERCCLKANDMCCQTAGAITCSWNPIVNPFLFTGSSTNSPPVAVSSSLRRLGRSLSWEPTLPYRSGTNDLLSDPERDYMWEVSGTYIDDKSDIHDFTYVAKNVVMACGSGKANALDVPGEDLPFVLHSLRELDTKIAAGDIDKHEPIMIVGAGLSAADAILAALEHDLHVLHVFRRSSQDRNIIFKSLPPKIYPEYHKVHRMMAGGRNHKEKYQALEKQHIIEIFADKRVKFHGEDATETVKVAFVVVLVGARPDLEFFDDACDNNDLAVDNMSLGILADTPVSKNNPVDINIYTFETVKHKGLYAMGPLVGDNFVRFLQGGALAISSDILKTDRKKSS